MFTIKLLQGSGDAVTTQVFSCAHYAIHEMPSCTEITLYKDFSTQYGTTYNVSSKESGLPQFNKAYIENINGKTINVI